MAFFLSSLKKLTFRKKKKSDDLQHSWKKQVFQTTAAFILPVTPDWFGFASCIQPFFAMQKQPQMFCISGHADIRETETLHKEHATITAKASRWVINLSATVRPVMTYLLFIEFMALTYLLAVGWIDNDMYSLIWSSEIQAVWSAVVSFWFGQRSFNRKS